MMVMWANDGAVGDSDAAVVVGDGAAYMMTIMIIMIMSIIITMVIMTVVI